MFEVISRLHNPTSPEVAVGILSGSAIAIAYGEKYKHKELIKEAELIRNEAIDYLVSNSPFKELRLK